MRKKIVLEKDCSKKRRTIEEYGTCLGRKSCVECSQKKREQEMEVATMPNYFHGKKILFNPLYSLLQLPNFTSSSELKTKNRSNEMK